MIPAKALQCLITADELQTKKIKLNGELLELTGEGELPLIMEKEIQAGELQLPPHSNMFLSFQQMEDQIN